MSTETLPANPNEPAPQKSSRRPAWLLPAIAAGVAVALVAGFV